MGNNEQNIDKRVLKTKKAIRLAFAELLSEKDLNEITIKDISDRAIINRKTFYSYYSGVYQLVDEIEDEIINYLRELLAHEDLDSIAKNPISLFNKTTAVINSNMDLYGFLMQRGHNTNLTAKIADELKATLKSSLLEHSGEDEAIFDLALDFVFAGLISVYQNWFNSDRSQSIEKVSEAVSTLMFSGINGLRK